MENSVGLCKQKSLISRQFAFRVWEGIWTKSNNINDSMSCKLILIKLMKPRVSEDTMNSHMKLQREQPML